MSEFLAEAQVRIVPNTVAFRAELEAQLRALTAKPVVIPVTAAAVGTGATGAAAAAVAGSDAVRNATLQLEAAAAAAAATEFQLAGALHEESVAATAAASSTSALAKVQQTAATGAAALARTEIQVASAASAAGAAARSVTGAVRQVALAQEGLAAALSTGNAQLIRAAALTNLLAKAQLEQAISARSAAGATIAHSRSLSGVGTGAASAGLSLLGLRGATLAANATFLAGAGAAIIFTKAVGASAALETELNVFEATAEATADQMERVSETARRLGTDLTLPGVGAADAAEAMTTLAKAGLTIEDSMTGARGALQLATAAEISNAEAAQITASALNSFALSGTEAVHVADLLTGAANASQASIADMGLALRQASAAAQAVGLGVEDTVALLSLLARNGVAASDAGTSLRTAIIRLVNPTEKARTEIEKLNLDLRNQQGELRPDIFVQFANATRDLARAERDRIAAVIFGQDAFRAQAILAREGAEGLRRAQEETNRSGEAFRIAEARTEGLTGKLGQLRNNAEEAGLSIGDFLKPGVKNFIDAINSTLTPATDDFTVRVRTVGDEWEELRDILAQPLAVSSSLADLASDLGTLTAIAQRFTEQGLDVPPDIQARIDALRAALNPRLSGALNRADESALALQKSLAALGDEAGRTETKMASFGSRLQRDIAVAAATGNEGAELRGLREQEQRQQAFLDRILARPQTQANVDLAKKAAENLERTRSSIQTILDGQAADAEAARSDARRARDRADDALLDILGGEERRARDRLLQAQGTDRLQDDIRFTDQLRAVIRQQIEQVRARVKDRERANDIIAGLVSELIQLNNQRKDLQRQLAEQQREAQEARLERVQRGTELDIELADIQENTRRSIALRLRLIAQLKKEARVLKLHGNALKENRNERARLRAEIEDLLETSKQDENLGAQLNFRILQQAQGFAANVMSNLIPAAATGGVLGGTTPAARADVPGSLGKQAAFAEGRTGVTRGQGNETNAILRDILRALETLNGRTIHPEATRQRRVQAGSMDTVAL